jgi:RHS repeat-associated protein
VPVDKETPVSRENAPAAPHGATSVLASIIRGLAAGRSYGNHSAGSRLLGLILLVVGAPWPLCPNRLPRWGRCWPGWPTDRGFLGKQDNKSTTLLDVGAREYDPDTFISPDPLLDLSDPRTFNPYGYANHTPITASDPTGLYVCMDVCGGADDKINHDNFLDWKEDERRKDASAAASANPVKNASNCSNKAGSGNPCNQYLTDEEREMQRRVEIMTASAQQNCASPAFILRPQCALLITVPRVSFPLKRLRGV